MLVPNQTVELFLFKFRVVIISSGERNLEIDSS